MVNWNTVAHWADVTWYSSPDFAAVIQEIIGLASWAGAAVVIYVEDNNSSAVQYTMRKCQTASAGVASGVILHIEFTL